MKRGSWLIVFLLFISINVFAQSWDDDSSDDSAMALKYINYIQEAIEKGKWDEAQYGFGFARAQDFNDVLSDISYLQAVLQHKNGPIDKKIIINNLNQAIDVNRWVIYSKNEALILKAELLISLRDYTDALECINIISRSAELASNAQMRADTAMLRIRALRAIAAGNTVGDPIQALAQFRSEVLLAMDRFPRDPRPLQYFFEYARNRKFAASELNSGDIGLLELVLKRLPFLLDADPNLAWMAAPFIYDLEYSRRLVGAYRSVNNPHPGSIPVALNLGLIDDDTAIEEIFSETEQYEIKTLDEDILIDTYNLLRREEGRELFSQRMLSFTGFIETDEDRDGIKDIFIYYKDGVLENFIYYKAQNNFYDFFATFEQNIPISCNYTVMGSSLAVTWERYPYVEKVERALPTSEVFKFGPAVFQYMPVKFIEIGGSNKIHGFPVPVIEHQYMELTRQTLFSFCSNYSRPSLEIKGAVETVYLERGVILQVVETLNEKQVSVTEFDRGLPLIQYIDLDMDGRMETIRQFRRPPQNYVWQDLLDYRRLAASSESDWSGDGKHKTREVYQLDGSVVYSFDMDGSGEMNYSETGNRR